MFFLLLFCFFGSACVLPICFVAPAFCWFIYQKKKKKKSSRNTIPSVSLFPVGSNIHSEVTDHPPKPMICVHIKELCGGSTLLITLKTMTLT